MVHRIFVVGVGMGNPQTLTLAARDALARSELVVGSSRLLEALGNTAARMVSAVVGEAIVRALREAPERVASVVMSGDVGFYSGAAPLLALLDEAGMGENVEVIPGISSLAYMCARLREPWHDAHVVSAHGRVHDAAGAIQSHAKTFVLLGGTDTAGSLCAQLVERGLGQVRIAVGERLSYADERIVRGTAAELAGCEFAGLSVLLAHNERPLGPAAGAASEALAPHLDDAAFVRGRVPMTKEEVRELAVCKLRVRPQSTVWDIGAGTGSVSVELARAAFAGRVYAVERNPEARALIEQNRAAFGLTNLQVVTGEAPEALTGLPAPDCVFVGGTAGQAAEVLEEVRSANPQARVCVAAVTLETLAAVVDYLRVQGVEEPDIAQVSVAKATLAGSSHLMRAHNPVYLVTFGQMAIGARPHWPVGLY